MRADLQPIPVAALPMAEIRLAAAHRPVQTNRGSSVTLGIFVAFVLIFLLGVICGVAGAVLALHIPIGK